MSQSLVTIDETAPNSARVRSREELADYLVEIGATLSAYGCPSYRLEDVIRLIADVEGHRADPFALPTALFLRVTSKDGTGHQVQRMTRVSDWGVDLARLTMIDEIFNDVVSRKTTIEQARVRIRDIVKRPSEWSSPFVFVAGVVVSASAAVFFRGGLPEILVAALIGAVIIGSRLLVVGSAAKPSNDPSESAGTSRRNARRLLSDFLGGLFAAACTWLALRVWPDVRPEVIVPAGAISLFPGMTFTTGVAEVAQKNLVAGGARLIESAVALLLILFGVALMAGLGEVVGAPVPSWLGDESVRREGLSLGWHAGALLASAFAFGAVFQVPRRWLWTTLASSATGWIVATVSVRHHLPGHVAAFCAALAVCVLANGLARATNRPAQLFQLPGMMLLVPGSFGFLSLGDFLEENTGAGTQRGFTMALVGAALVIGVLVANVLVPSRKLL